MKRLSKLSRVCIANKGLCCENRTPPFFSPSEIELLLKEQTVFNEFLFGKCSARPKSSCPFFKEPFCQVYEERPVDCRTYPVSIELDGEKVIYVVDMNCPAVKKGLVSKRFIQQAIKTWREKIPSQDWIREYLAKDEVKNYKWVGIDEYQNYRIQLMKTKRAVPHP